jgi:hypothetical protein
MQFLGDKAELRGEVIVDEKDIAHALFLPNAHATCDRFPRVDRG